MRFAAVCLLSAVALVCSCDGDGSMLPKSGGRPYEVLVTGGGDAAVAAVAGTLSAAAPGLPQCEPLFDVSTAVNSASCSVLVSVVRFTGAVSAVALLACSRCVAAGGSAAGLLSAVARGVVAGCFFTSPALSTNSSIS